MAKRVYLLGAGASNAYDRSIFGVRPPLARGFFNAYHELPISGDFNVKVGAIVNFVRDHYGIPTHHFYIFDEDVEAFLVRLDDFMQPLYDKAGKGEELTKQELGDLWQAQRATFELLVLFSRVLIDTTDGPPCPFHDMLVANLSPEDAIISFNWDPLIDRSLHKAAKWFPDDGYGLSFEALMDGEWRLPASGERSTLKLLKLHGSINWLIAYPGLDSRTGKEMAILPLDRYHDKFCFINLKPHPPFGCREVLMNPLVPPKRDDGKVSITMNMTIDPKTIRYKPEIRTFGDYTPAAKLTSLIITPRPRKKYDLPGQVFDQLWPQALRSLIASDELYICGYSLPDTDERPRSLLRQAAQERGGPWRIGMVTPHPEPLEMKLRQLMDGTDIEIRHEADSFEKFVAPNAHDLLLPGPAA